jgi:hypothetical protein
VTAVLFDISRLSRQVGVLAVWFAIALGAGFEVSNNPNEIPALARFWPLPVLYLSAWAFRSDLRRGAFDILVSRGNSPQVLMYVRMGVTVVAGVISLAILCVTPILNGGGIDGSNALLFVDLAVLVVYWAVVGAVIGFFLSQGSLTALVVVGGVCEVVWLYWGCVHITGNMPDSGWRALATAVIHLCSPLPARDFSFPFEVFPFEALRLVAGGLLVALGHVHLSRRSLNASEEG